MECRCPRCNSVLSIESDYDLEGNRTQNDWYECKQCGYQEAISLRKNDSESPQGWSEVT